MNLQRIIDNFREIQRKRKKAVIREEGDKKECKL